jgi:hypothetical protein
MSSIDFTKAGKGLVLASSPVFPRFDSIFCAVDLADLLCGGGCDSFQTFGGERFPQASCFTSTTDSSIIQPLQ